MILPSTDILGQWITEDYVVDRGLQTKASIAYADYKLSDITFVPTREGWLYLALHCQDYNKVRDAAKVWQRLSA